MESPVFRFYSPNPRIVAQVLGALEGFAVTMELSDGETLNGVISGVNEDVGNVLVKRTPQSASTMIFPVEMIETMEIM